LPHKALIRSIGQITSTGQGNTDVALADAGAQTEIEVPPVGNRQIVGDIVKQREDTGMTAIRGRGRVDVVIRPADFHFSADAIRETEADRSLNKSAVAGVDLVDLVSAGINQRALWELNRPHVIPAGA